MKCLEIPYPTRGCQIERFVCYGKPGDHAEECPRCEVANTYLSSSLPLFGRATTDDSGSLHA